MDTRRAFGALTLLVLPACGASTGLLTPPPELTRSDAMVDDAEGADGGVDGRADASTDVTSLDGGILEGDASADTSPDVFFGDDDAGACEEGQNTDFPPVGCGGTTSLWLAGPYRSVHDISVDLVQVHTMGGNIAILTSVGGAPGEVLFTGSVGPSASPAWLGATVSPPVKLQAGVQYFLANQEAYCSQSIGGPDDIEYGAPTLDGPWMVTGTDNWTARLSGTCP